MKMPIKPIKLGLVALSVIAIGFASSGAQEEVYEYDALGRLVKVTQQDTTIVDFAYDAAGNRTNVTNTGSGVSDPTAPNPNGGAIIVVPLNGFTVIVVD